LTDSGRSQSEISVIPGDADQASSCVYDHTLPAKIYVFARCLVAPELGHIVNGVAMQLKDSSQ
jgi:hypothetical protein